jgi:hypothetical protein
MRSIPPLLSVLLATAITTGSPVYGQVASQPAAPRKWALLVGVNSYQNRNLVPLKFAERDVTELGKVLTGGGFEVRVLTGNQTNAKKYREELQKMLKQLNRNDLLLLAFSGHGVQMRVDNLEQPCFCPFDAVPSDPSTMVLLSGVLKDLHDQGAGTNLVLVDACRDISDANRGSRSGIDGNRVENLPEGTALFFSCSSRQRAMETEKAGGGHGVFFHSVLEGLRGKPSTRDDKGNVTWGRLTNYVSERVEANAALWFNENERQVPHKVENLTKVLPLMVAASGDVEKEVPPMRPDQKPRLGGKLGGLLKKELQKDKADPAIDRKDAILDGADKIVDGVLNIIRDQPGNRPNSDNPGPKPKEGKSRIQPKAKVADAG